MEKYGRRCGSTTYDPTKYKTYLEQLGITYPTVRPAPQKTTASAGLAQ